MLSAYLAELEREFSRRLSPEEVQARLAEAEAHLRDGIEGRLELGLMPQEAEREAVEAFGLSRQIAQATSVERPDARARIGLLLSGYALASLFFLFGYRYLDLYPTTVKGLCLVWGGLAVVFAACAFRARRAAPVRVFGTGLFGALALWAVVGTSWLDLTPYGGGGVVPPGEAGRQLAEARRMLAERAEDRAALHEGLAMLRAPSGVESLRTFGGYRAPVVKDAWGYDERVAFQVVPDAKAAVTAWTEAGRRERGWLETDRLERMVRAIPQAQADSPWRSLRNVAPSFLPGGIAVAASAVLLDLGASGLGAVAFALRRRPKGRLRA